MAGGFSWDSLFTRPETMGMGADAGAAASAGGLDAATMARLAQMRAADSAAVEAARAPYAAPDVAPAATPKAGFGARVAGALNPNIGALAAGAGKATLALAPAMGAISAFTDSSDDVRKQSNLFGLNYDTPGGRIGANFLNFLNKTGGAASFGLAPALGRLLAGGSFFGDDTPAAAKPVVAPAATPAPAAAAPDSASASTAQPTGNPLVDLVTKAATFTPPAAPQPQLTALGPAEEKSGYIEGPNGRIELPSGTVQRFGVRRPTLAQNIDSLVATRSARKNQELNIEGAKAAIGVVGAGKRSAEEMIAQSKVGAATAWLQKNPGDLGGFAAILAGKDPKEVAATLNAPSGAQVALHRDNTATIFGADGKLSTVPVPKYRTPTQGQVDDMLKNKNNATYKNSFIQHFGPDAYKSLVENR